MLISDRAAQLRAALEEALDGEQVDLFPVQHGTRISALAPAADEWDRWHQVIAVLQTADEWGSSSAGGTPKIWAEIKDEVST
ncbi:hypothetical protein [Streptomyces sp. A012304]|uniref:hypothetical protein n=1 Tax=Streptomyces sp. A012304 TaxID=375446 RepID=UPI00222FF6F2|nr:hypothetical protein [Streptomyces sp. A012304]GKQ34479.1 hypothetical protein ALMP_10280 [Streptomyces sp. A012304]